jgi:hypothetical protein
MLPAKSVHEFETFAETHGVSFVDILPSAAFEQMFLFYQSEPAGGCTKPEADMLLYQWGTYDWGEGMHFELNLTRQFIEDEKEGDDAISQLQVTFSYGPSRDLIAKGNGNHWCRSVAELADFKKFILARPEFVALANIEPPAVSIRHEYV